MKIEQVPIGRFQADPLNPRRMSTEEADALRRSMERFGAVQPAVYTGEFRLIAGHMRVAVAEQMGWETYPAIEVEDLSESEARTLGLALNRISGEWDEQLLGEVLYGLTEEEGMLASTGFSAEEIEQTLRMYAGDEMIEPALTWRDRAEGLAAALTEIRTMAKNEPLENFEPIEAKADDALTRWAP